MTRWRAALTVLVSAVVVAAVAHGAGTRSYTIDSGRSSATIEVGKSGAFSFVAGHSHEVVAPAIAGTITVDADDPVAVRMDSNTLTATGRFTVKQKDHGSKPVSVGGVV